MGMQHIARQVSDIPTNLSDVSSAISSVISSVIDSSTPTDTSISDIETTSPISTSALTSPTTISTASPSPSPLPTSLASQSAVTSATTSFNVNTATSVLSATTDSSITSATATLSESTVSSTTTANLTTIVTIVSGIPTTFTSQLPTSLVTSSPTKPDSHRTTIIAAATSALFALIILTLAAIFAYRKHTLRKTKADLQIRREGHGLLDGEEFDDDAIIPPHMRQVSAQRHSFARSNSPTPSLLKSRITDTGSIFREEVWPPPSFVDPISKNNSQVDLSQIVDDVMGASSSRHTDRYPSDSTDLSDLSTSRTITSTAPLSLGNHWRRSTSSLGNDDPFGVSSSQTSFYPPSSYRVLPGASPPSHPGLIASTASSSYPHISSESSSFQVSASDSTVDPSMSVSSSASIPGSTLSVLVPPPRPLSGTVPKKSSPLARALTQDQKLFSSTPLNLRESFDR